MPARNRMMTGLLACILLIPALISCIAATPPVTRIGLVAPFEGRFREIGVDVIPAVRLALREWSASVAGEDLAIELIAYDDLGTVDEAAIQAERLTADPSVVVVIGHWLDWTTQAAAPIYAEHNVELVALSPYDISGTAWNLVPDIDFMMEEIGLDFPTELAPPTPDQFFDQIYGPSDQLAYGPLWGLTQSYQLAGQPNGIEYITWFASPAYTMELLDIVAFDTGYREGSLDVPPGQYAISAYLAAWVAIERAAALNGIVIQDHPASHLEFDDGRRVNAPYYQLYWEAGERIPAS